MIPSFAILQVEATHFHMPRLWLPLFLLWIPVILLSPLILIVILGLCIAGRINPWRAIAVFWSILCNLPGTHVHVSAHDSKVLVRIL
ncbi:MAG: hypothetical protein P4K93_07850 [Terracidiphilus sp.]|nr:hypothetical protein [Terracidiphilus sp.]